MKVNLDSAYLDFLSKANVSDNQSESDSVLIQPKTLLDYMELSNANENGLDFDCCTYCNIDVNAARKNLVKNTVATNQESGVTYPTTDQGELNDEEYWTQYDALHYDVDKVNYCIDYYLENGFDAEYPVEGDDEKTQKAYIALAKMQGYEQFREQKVENAIQEAGYDEVTFTIDAKGEISVLSGSVNGDAQTLQEKLNDVLVDMKDYVSDNGSYFSDMTDEQRAEATSIWGKREGLYKTYGLQIEDLWVNADGTIGGATEELQAECEEYPLYKADLIEAINAGVSSSTVIGTISYKDGVISVQ